MCFNCFINNINVGNVYAPNYETALKRAIKEYGENVMVEEK